MKKMLRTTALMAAVVLTSSVAFAGGEGCTGEKKASSDCASKCSGEVTKTMASGCSTAEMADKAGCSMDKAACEKSCATVAKGGAEDAGKDVTVGYGLGNKVPGDLKATCSVTNEVATLYDGKAAATVLVFWNQDCPYVVEMQDRFGKFAEEMKEKNVRVIALDAGVDKPESAIKEYASARPFPVLMNRDSMHAVNFKATKTPEVFVLDKNGVIQYHGSFDGGKKDPNATYALNAVTAVLDGKTPEVKTMPAFGCSIKYSAQARAAMEAKDASASLSASRDLRARGSKEMEAAKTRTRIASEKTEKLEKKGE